MGSVEVVGLHVGPRSEGVGAAPAHAQMERELVAVGSARRGVSGYKTQFKRLKKTFGSLQIHSNSKTPRTVHKTRCKSTYVKFS